jgi:hypothetical protein
MNIILTNKQSVLLTLFNEYVKLYPNSAEHDQYRILDRLVDISYSEIAPGFRWKQSQMYWKIIIGIRELNSESEKLA